MTESRDRNIKTEGEGETRPPGGRFLSLSAFIVMMIVIMSLFFLLLEPESASVKRELKKHSEAMDKARFLKEEAYRQKFKSETESLQFTLARAYNGERTPDLALTILEGLIKERERPAEGDEKRVESDPTALRMRALYWEEMANSFKLKSDPEKRETALKNRDRLRQKARDAAREAAERDAKPKKVPE